MTMTRLCFYLQQCLTLESNRLLKITRKPKQKALKPLIMKVQEVYLSQEA